jgi:HAD superfamily hydrolase (TIGR01509 family)
MVIKALIFDFDGLILDTESPEVDAWKEIYAEHGQEFPIDVWIREVVGSTIANFNPAADLASRLGQSLDEPSLHARARKYRLKTLETQPARPGINEYVRSARRLGLRLAVASSSTHAWVEGYLRQLGLLDFFEAILGREDVRKVKPDPELFLKAMEAVKLPAEECLAFEDSPNGVVAARQAGLRVVAIPNPITALGKTLGASRRLASLADLPLEDLLKQMDYEIRPEDTLDSSEIRQVEEQAFQRPTEADLVELCRRHGKVSLSLVAVRDGEMAGHILFTPVSVEPAPAGLRGLGLGPIAVLPKCQGTGIGSGLMQTGLESCRAQGFDFIVLLGDPRYYSRFGFTPARDFGLSSAYGSGDEFQLLELRPGVLAGATGMVRYIPEFAELDC